MKKGVEIPKHDNPEVVDNKKIEKSTGLNLSPESGDKFHERSEKAKEARLRGDLVARIDTLKDEFGGLEMEIGGEKYVLNFSALLKDGKRVEKTEELKKEAEDKNFKLDRVSGQFTLSVAGQKDAPGLAYTLPIRRVLSCETSADLKKALMEVFAGTDDYYKKIQANSPKQPEVKPSKESAEKKENKMAEIKKAAAEAGDNVSILESKSFTSIIVRASSSKQLHIASADLAVWSVAEVQNGKITGKTTTDNPVEFIKPAEKEPTA